MSAPCAVEGCALTARQSVMCDMHEQRRRDSDAATALAVVGYGKRAPRCDVCHLPMVAWQRGRHGACCASLGGRDPLCQPIAKTWYDDADSGYRPCAICWRLGPFLGLKIKRAPAKRKTKARAA